jgi:hypothetical protein
MVPRGTHYCGGRNVNWRNQAPCAIVVVLMGLAGCVDPAVLGDRGPAPLAQDRFVRGEPGPVAGDLIKWLEQNAGLTTSHEENGVNRLECLCKTGGRFYVILTRWPRKNGVFTRVHLEGNDPMGMALLAEIDRLNERREKPAAH